MKRVGEGRGRVRDWVKSIQSEGRGRRKSERLGEESGRGKRKSEILGEEYTE